MNDSPEKIKAILQTEANLLEDFLLQNEVYRQIQISEFGNQIHLMSLGDFLEYRAVGDTLGVTSDTAMAEPAWQELLRVFQVRAAQLGARELKARLDSLQWNMEDWSKEGGLNQRHYAAAMTQRTRMQRVGNLLGWFGLESSLAQIDSRIRHLTMDGPFIWTRTYREAYPPSDYWFLYRQTR